MAIKSWVRELTEEVLGGPPFKIGDKVHHPDGRLVEIVDGQYWGMDGLSNWWYWREVFGDGSLSPKLESGYGWDSK